MYQPVIPSLVSVLSTTVSIQVRYINSFRSPNKQVYKSERDPLKPTHECMSKARRRKTKDSSTWHCQARDADRAAQHKCEAHSSPRAPAGPHRQRHLLLPDAAIPDVFPVHKRHSGKGPRTPVPPAGPGAGPGSGQPWPAVSRTRGPGCGSRQAPARHPRAGNPGLWHLRSCSLRADPAASGPARPAAALTAAGSRSPPVPIPPAGTSQAGPGRAPTGTTGPSSPRARSVRAAAPAPGGRSSAGLRAPCAACRVCSRCPEHRGNGANHGMNHAVAIS